MYTWKEHDSFWEYLAPQGTEEWKKARIGRMTGSVSSDLNGEENKKQEEVGQLIAGVKEEEFSEDSLKFMAHGTEYESVARNWYERKKNCKVLERGLCVPKWDYRIGASVDGEVDDGIIEIKCPQKMYKPIDEYTFNIKLGWKPPPKYTGHIWRKHLSQCMQGMAVLNKKWCDYIVFSTFTSQVFLQRVYFDPDFWEEKYSLLIRNYEKFVLPYVKNLMLPF